MTLPEGRQPTTPDDMAKLHPSTWAEECEQLRAKYDALREVVSRLIEERDRALAWRDKDWEASQENTALRVRVAELQAAIEQVKATRDEVIEKYRDLAQRYVDRTDSLIAANNRVIAANNRVATLEAALAKIVLLCNTYPGIADGAGEIARAALEQTTEPHTAPHSAKSDTR